MTPEFTDAAPGGVARLAPLPASALDPYARSIFDALAPGASANMVATMAHHPALFERFLPVTQAIHAGELSERHRELAVLRVAAWRRCRYVWEQHVRIARRAGVSEADLAALGADAADPAWQPADRAVLCAVDELLERSTVSDATWQALADVSSPAQLVELCLLVGHYSGLCFLANAAAVQPDAGGDPVPPLPARAGA